MGISDFFKPKWKHSQWETRLAGIKNLEDQSILTDIAKNDGNIHVRKAAVKKLQDQTVLADIAKNDKQSEIRQAAVKQLQDQSILMDIANNDQIVEVCCTAVEKLDNQSILLNIARDQTKTPDIRKTAVKELQDQSSLADIGKDDGEESEIRQTAINKLENQSILANIAQNDKYMGIRKVATMQLKDQSILAAIAKNDNEDRDVRNAAIDRLETASVLTDIAQNDRNSLIRKFAAEKQGDQTTLAPLTSLESLGFKITDSCVKPPVCDFDSSQKEWLPKLEGGRKNAVQFRRNFLAGMPSLKDPVDQPMPNWYSVGIVFDWEKMDSNYGRQVFDAFFHHVQPSNLQKEVVLHFGDLIQFEAFCALLARSTSLNDITTIACKFGPSVDTPGLLPHPRRFLTASKKDGHIIARSFSLPISAAIRGNRVFPDPQAGVGWMIEAAIKGTNWRM